MSASPDDVNFFDPATNNCPYAAYKTLREQAPVWKDPVTGMYVITRYEDVREILSDTERFRNGVSGPGLFSKDNINPDDPEKARQLSAALAREEEIKRLYEEEGWPPVPTLDALDDPKHMELRRVFDAAFRPARIAELDPFVESLAHRLVDAFVDRGRCEFVSEFAIPLPLFVVGRQMGIEERHMLRIKEWTESFAQRLGLMQNPEERVESARKEIEFQKFFQPIFERLRREPDDSLLSDLVNKEIPEWGRPLTDAELHSEMMIDFMVGGSETTTNALSGGILLLLRDPAVGQYLAADLEGNLPKFVEEVLRLEGPVQGLVRQNVVDVELHGVKIPAGSVLNVRYAAANRDERHFACPEQIDLERKRIRSHLAFGVGTHMCLGAPLARRELYYGFKAVLQRLEHLRFAEAEPRLEYHPNYFLRGLRQLHIAFEPSKTGRGAATGS
jgi:cytochrome P450